MTTNMTRQHPPASLLAALAARPRLLNIICALLTLGWLALVSTTLSTDINDARQYWRGASDMLTLGDPYASTPDRATIAELQSTGRNNFEASYYLYPPLFAYLAQPLGMLNERQAQLVIFGLNIVGLSGLIWLCLQVSASNFAKRYWGLVALMAMVVPFTRLSLQLGQVSIMLTLTIVGAYTLAKFPGPLAGLLNALAAMIKIYPLLLWCYYLWRGPRRTFWWSLFAAVLLLISSLVIYGSAPYASFIEKVLRSAAYPYAAEHNISLVGFFSRMLTVHRYGVAPLIMPWLAQLLGAMTSLAVLGGCLWATARASTSAAPLVFSVWLCTMLLISPANGYYNLVALLFPLLCGLRALEIQPDRNARNLLVLATALSCIPPGWSSALPIYTLVHTGWGLLLLTPSLYGLCLYLGLMIWLAQRPAHSTGELTS